METEIFATTVFSSISLKEQVNSKWKRASDSTWHGHARAWDVFSEFMSFLLFCHVLPLDLFVCQAVLSKATSEWRSHGVTLNALGLRYEISLSLPLNSLLKPRYSEVIHGVLHVKAWMKKTNALQVTSAPFTGRRRNKNPLEHPSMSTKKNRSLGQQLHAFETLQQTEGELPCLVLQDAVSGGFCCGVNP